MLQRRHDRILEAKYCPPPHCDARTLASHFTHRYTHTPAPCILTNALLVCRHRASPKSTYTVMGYTQGQSCVYSLVQLKIISRTVSREICPGPRDNIEACLNLSCIEYKLHGSILSRGPLGM